MAEDRDDSDRTEEPTPRKLEEAREQGRVASSRDVGSCLLLGLAALIAGGTVPVSSFDLRGRLASFLGEAHLGSGDPAALGARLLGLVAGTGQSLLVPLGLASLLVIVASLGQHGLLFTPSGPAPQASRISPVAGLGRLFSVNSIVELARSMLKLIVIGIIGFNVVRDGVAQMLAAGEIGTGEFVGSLEGLAAHMLKAVAAATAMFALADYLWQRHSLMKQLRMTRQEVMDENKNSEGNPAIKQRVRSIRQARARQRMMADVPKATVVITNPTHFAVALRYVPEEGPAPVVVAKGADKVAARIREVAQAHGVPMVENPPLARMLHATLDIGEAISPEHYQAVAEVIGYVMRLRERARR